MVAGVWKTHPWFVSNPRPFIDRAVFLVGTDGDVGGCFSSSGVHLFFHIELLLMFRPGRNVRIVFHGGKRFLPHLEQKKSHLPTPMIMQNRGAWVELSGRRGIVSRGLADGSRKVIISPSLTDL